VTEARALDGDAGLRRLLRATGYSWSGLRAAWRSEAASLQELAPGLVVVPLGLLPGKTAAERALLVMAWLLVLYS
jgi:diacylglycerol kinase (ATP)